MIGYMASGKSSIGKILAKKLNLSFMDLDDHIVKEEGLSITNIFKTKGEIYFRRKEAEYLNQLLHRKDSFILAVGGGTPCYGSNMDIINKYTKSIYLKSSIQTIYDKLSKPKNRNKRPLITAIANKDLKEFIAKHLFERASYYDRASFTVNVDYKTKSECADEIVAIINMHHIN